MAIDRRSAIAALAALPLGRALSAPESSADATPYPRPPAATPLLRTDGSARHFAVIGAGAFGGWTAWHLRRAGHRVTLIDAYGAGNSRASSGGETRLIRAVYNGQREYTDLVARAFALWREYERSWGARFLTKTGALWMFEGDDDAFARRSLELMRAHRLPLEEVELAAAARRWPQLSFAGVRHVWFEPEAGELLARAACETVREQFVKAGGEYRTALARLPASLGRHLSALPLGDGSTLTADAYVFACGPWLGRLFPDAVGKRIRATRQEMFYFGTPAGDTRFLDPAMPAWANFGDRLIYGMPGNERRGFKAADDSLGDEVDPDTLERLVRPEALSRVRAFVARRFPALAKAPLLETRVCQYEYSTDGDFVVDRHPAVDNLWIAGGGSGHGFKMGPAIGEHIAAVVQGDTPVRPKFSLLRLTNARPAPATRRG
ncbi:MAG: FAD-dependent oxidoreductase [Gemmatimonadaceae bacterium]|nr:FAD-dependent oxidoreductase [Gemmatimonadaceae bacterium]